MPLRDLPVGTRLIIRTKTDWRSAVISRIGESGVSLRVCCSSGRVYWTKRASEMEVLLRRKHFPAGNHRRRRLANKFCQV